MTDTLAAESPTTAPQRARVAVPFILCTLIWSSTWLVIRTQLHDAPGTWSVTYRFAIAGVAMAVAAVASGASLHFSPRQHGLAIVYGVAQYSLNYHCVYLAERSVTSGLVAVLFALLIVPNALFAWVFLKQGVSRPFLIGSAVAMVGMTLLFVHELHAAGADHAALMAGIGWSLAGVLFSSIANVAQASGPARALPVASLIAWGMAYGTLFDAAVAWAIDGPPVLPAAPGYWAGAAYLGLVGSALAFSFYFRVIRGIGPGRAAYTSVLSPPLAMVLSTVFEGYRWSWEAGLGGFAALAGLVVALRARQSASPAR
jgi:drug/metabolite transporter (DMT)-like permease